MSDTIERSQVHSTFVIERTYPVSMAAVWHAISDGNARAQWFSAGDAFDIAEKSHDFRVGGQSIEDGHWHDGPRSRFVATYTDIVEGQRMVFTYDMWIDGKHLSTSLTTMALESDGDQTRLSYTEQAVYFDGLDTGIVREEGCKGLLGQLGSYLTAER